jgi:putative ABC transport system permease protein
MSVIVRADSDAAALVPAIRAEVFAIDSEQPVQSVRTLESLISSSIRQPRFIATLLCAFAAAALSLAVAGLYGVISYSVAQRTREIGIRVALGACRSDVSRLVVGQGMKLALIGVAVGIIASAMLTRLVSNLLFGVTATDPATYVVTAGLVIVVSVLASYVPARKASRVDPIIALRCE